MIKKQSDMKTEIYYLGDFSYILDKKSWQDLCVKISNKKNKNDLFVFQLEKKEISCHISKCKIDINSFYEICYFDNKNLVKILHNPNQIQTNPNFTTIGLICLNQMVNDETELSKLIKNIQDNNYGLLFSINKKIRFFSTKPVLFVEDQDCSYCCGWGGLDGEECYECNGTGYNPYEKFSHKVKLKNKVLFGLSLLTI